MSSEQLISVPSYLSETDSGVALASNTDCCQGSICEGQSVTPGVCSDGSTQICIGTQSCTLCEYGSQQCIYLCEVCQGQICFSSEGCTNQVCTCELVSSQDGTGESQAAFTITGITDTTVTIYVSGVTTETKWLVICRLADDEDDRTSQSVLEYTDDFEHTFTGLTPNTFYYVNVGSWNADTASYDFIGRQEVTTDPSTEEWSWWSNIASGALISISADEWNAFCAFINEVRTNSGLSSYSFTTVYSGTLISAAIVNQARTAIDSISGHGTLPAAVSTGDTITANFFLQLASAVNAAL